MSADDDATLTLMSRSPRQSEAIAAILGGLLQGGERIALEGGLGAGKTTWTRGLVEGVQSGEGEFVSSPTYAVCHVYPTTPEVYHYDLYRLTSEDDLESVGYYDTPAESIVLLEWANNVPSVRGAVDLEVHLEPADNDPDTRTLTFVGVSPAGRARVRALRAAVEA